jgi:hypothetical protein
MRVFRKNAILGFVCRIEPRSSRTEGVCSTDAPLHILCYYNCLFFKQKIFLTLSLESFKYNINMQIILVFKLETILVLEEKKKEKERK